MADTHDAQRTADHVPLYLLSHCHIYTERSNTKGYGYKEFWIFIGILPQWSLISKDDADSEEEPKRTARS